MNENYEYVQKGLRIFHPLFAGFVCMKLHKEYKEQWWGIVLTTLSDHVSELPSDGTYAELMDSLDIANCIRLLQRRWREQFSYYLDRDALNLSNELMSIRNIIAHIGQQDLSKPDAERYLDTITRFCDKIDAEGAKEIRELYNIVRHSENKTSLSGPMPISETLVNDLGMREGLVDDLMTLIRTNKIYKTKITKKITFAGKTELYPVYRVRLDALYYIDQNDRIATWISAYRAEHGVGTLSSLESKEYNDVIENFIYESNPESIKKTQRNIRMVGQQQPGVILADGRVVDGNRRFTCLRRIQRETGEKQFFETVIMNADMNKDRKQIKLLELAIQHGEEKKVDYDLIDYAIGTYRDIVITGLLTAEEYASGTNESVSDVRKRIEIAEMISRFLEYVKLPGQYHVAKECQLYSMFVELLPMLSKLNEEDKARMMQIAFNNVLLKVYADQRKFIRDIKKLMSSEVASDFLAEQDAIAKQVKSVFEMVIPESKADLDNFALANRILADDIMSSTEKSLLFMRTQSLMNRPGENVSKCKNLLMDIDPRLFSKLDDDEKTQLRSELDYLSRIVENLKIKLM